MILPQNSDYAMVSNNEAASIICRFTPTMIEDIVSEAISNKFRYYSLTSYNLVESLETEYRMASSGLPEYSPELMQDRHDNYIRIINQICNAHNIEYVFGDDQDMYSIASGIYDLLVSRFNVHIINFFVNYINKNKDMIYESLKLEERKKELSPYSKKIFKSDSSNKLASIFVNLEYVLDNILSYDIDFSQFLYFALIPNNIRIQVMQSILFDKGDFVKRIITPHFKNNPNLITHIKFALQGLSDLTFTDI